MNKIINQYNKDVDRYGSYIYTRKNKLSSTISNNRLTKATLEFMNLRDKKIIDIGCGDGTYTYEIYKRGKVRSITGIDYSEKAIQFASSKFLRKGQINFILGNACNLKIIKKKFDVAILRGVLHHLSNPMKAISEAMKKAEYIIVIEPNGLNPFVKLIEILSPYHRSHFETSYQPTLLKKWVHKSNGIVVKEKHINFVPFFCPDVMAKFMKMAENKVEESPLSRYFCSAYIFMYKQNIINK